MVVYADVSDMRVITQSDRRINLTGIDNHEVVDLPIVTTGAVANTATSGEVILIFHQYAYMHNGNTIHSSIQLEHFKNVVDERATSVVR